MRSHDVERLFDDSNSASNLALEWIRKRRGKEYSFEYVDKLVKGEQRKWKQLLGAYRDLRLRLVSLRIDGAGIMFYYAIANGDKAAENLLLYTDCPPRMPMHLAPRFLTPQIVWLYATPIQIVGSRMRLEGDFGEFF